MADEGCAAAASHARSAVTLSTTNRVGARLDRFSFFFAFYGLILGLAVTELLGGVARLVRAGERRIEIQTTLLAVLTFLIIVVTWIEAFETLRDVQLNLANLWAPVLLATLYYLAASVVFPSDHADFDDLKSYYAAHKGFVVAMLFGAEVVITIADLHIYRFLYNNRPAEFWIWMLPFKLAILGGLAAIYFARSRRANVVALSVSLLLFTLPNWQYGIIREAIASHFGYTL